MTELASAEQQVSSAGFATGVPGITPPSMPGRSGVFLDDVVVELGLADRETVDEAVQSAQQAEKSLDRYLLESGVLDEDQLSRAVAERNGLDHIDLDQFEVDTGAAQLVTRSAAERYSAVPVAFAADGAVIVAIEDPFDTLGISDIEVMTRSEVRPAIATASGIRALIETLPERPASKPPPQPSVDAPAEEPVVEEEDPVNENNVGGEDKDVSFGAVVEGSVPPPTSEPVIEADVVPAFEADVPPAFEVGAPPVGEPEPTVEPDASPGLEPEPIVGLAAEPEPFVELAAEPEPAVELDEEPDVEPVPLVEVVPEQAGSEPRGEGADLSAELGSLRETATRADELAATVERRIEELQSADERSQRLEADLDAARRRVEELEGQVTGVDAVAEELRATTEKLEEVNRVLEGSLR